MRIRPPDRDLHSSVLQFGTMINRMQSILKFLGLKSPSFTAFMPFVTVLIWPLHAVHAQAPQGSLSARTSASTPALGVNASLHGRRPFPHGNPWNTPIDDLPVDENTTDYLESIGLDKHLHPDFGYSKSGLTPGIPYVVVGKKQPKSVVRFEYPGESDRGPYPIPADPPIEGGPQSDGDRHLLIIDRDAWKLYELFAARREGGEWAAGSGAMFDLNSNKLRPAGWTSADAAGLPIFPGLVRYDEVVEQQEIRHALRFTVRKTRRAYIAPARHWASSHTEARLPPMGLRVRLKASYDISGFPPNVQVILRALKKYGMLLADNGGDWFITGVPDARWDDDELGTLKRVKGRDLEVVETGEIVTR